MSQVQNPYASFGRVAAEATVDERADFIRKTYLHLGGAVLLFIILESIWFASGFAAGISMSILGTRWGWLAVLGAFMVVSFIANRMASSATSPGVQYLGLGLYVLIESLIFVPLLYVARAMEVAQNVEIIMPAGLITMVIFAGLTVTVFFTAKDFSFLRGILIVGSFGAMALILAAILFGFNLGVIFTWAMVVLMSGWILYETSNVLYHYQTTQHVAAALALFASLATLFWYVLQLVMRYSSDD